MTTHPPTDPIADLHARLDAAHALPGGPARERAITEAALAAVVTEIRRRAPSVRYVEFDWAAYGGLDAHAFLDTRGNEIEVPGLAGDLAHWATDLRSPDMAAMIAISPRGPFLLDLEAAPTVTAAGGEPCEGSANPRKRAGRVRDAYCPILVGDQLAYADRPGLLAEVTRLRFESGFLDECEVLRADGVRESVLPWMLVPTDGTIEPWQTRMRMLYAFRRAHANDLLRDNSLALAERADALSRTLAAMAADLRNRVIPHASAMTTQAARDIDEGVEGLASLYDELNYLHEHWTD
ncbi:hypothetical protein B7C42_08067 [Nocardia cerradoensis]|uniref:Uncharacterized protein n=1 Tax=Nocardia cerradoensis TaxID=85688 RepID=A0A231GTH8_9NOCA|nr:hypothetical protein [Nocardia cerradoensis]OXR39855.1 hypothetical protein B7C42_08067 [Nocardia cerradoensis]